MTRRTLQRLMAEGADPSAEPVLLPPGAADREMLEALQQELGGEDTHLYERTVETLLQITVRVETVVEERYGQPFEARFLVAFRKGRLSMAPELRYDDAGAPLAGAPHLRQVIARMHAHLEGRARQALRRDKLRKLGRRAVEGKVQALSERTGIWVEAWHTRSFRLMARIAADEMLAFDVPYLRPDARLAEVERAVIEARAAHEARLERGRALLDARDRASARRRASA